MKYLVDNKKYLWQHNKLHPLTAIRRKCISETMYGDIEKNIQQDSQEYITPEGREGLSTQKLANCEIKYGLFSCQYCTKSFCLDIKKKINVIEKLYLPIRTLNMNDDNEEKCHGISIDFIKKLADFFIIIG